jgi:YesN/AraC family two-component response regulator
MPEMNGLDLASKIRSLNPLLRCLYMSGYTADIIARHGVADTTSNFIEKPFSTHELTEKVRAVLDADG